VKFWLLDNHHETVASSNPQLAEPHEKDESLEGDQSAAIATRGKRHAFAFGKMWKYAFENTLAIGSGEPKLKLYRPSQKCCDVSVDLADEFGQVVIGL
jgi:hypothetical protein